MPEEVHGPWKGYFVAAYALGVLEHGQRSFVGYYKICSRQPDSYWESACLLKGCADGGHASAADAMEAACSAAAADIGNMPHCHALAAADERRPMYGFELHMLRSGTLPAPLEMA